MKNKKIILECNRKPTIISFIIQVHLYVREMWEYLHSLPSATKLG